MSLSPEELRTLLPTAERSDLRRIIRSEVLQRTPHCFEGDVEFYAEIRAHLACQLRSSVDEIYMVGSGAVGYSLAPTNFPRSFREQSDLDFAVVSPKLFDEAWTSLLQWGHPQRRHGPAIENAWLLERQSEIFWGWLDPEQLQFKGILRPKLLREIQVLKTRWFETFRNLGSIYPETEVATRHCSARLYRSEQHLVEYQTEGLRRLKNRLIQSEKESNGLHK